MLSSFRSIVRHSLKTDGVSEFVARDIGLTGPDCDGNEYAVSICAEDNRAPYDYELTSRLIPS